MVRWRLHLLCAAAFAAFCGRAVAQEVWTGIGGDTNWHTNLNWASLSAPGTSYNNSISFTVASLSTASTVDNGYSITQLNLGATLGSLDLDVSNSGYLNISSGTTYTGTNGVNVYVPLEGAGGLTLDGSGNFYLNGADTYSGTTLVTTGTLLDGADNAFSPNSPIQVAGSGTLTVLHSESVPGLNDASVNNAGTVNIASGGTLNLTALSTFSGTLMGTGTLKVTVATATLTGDSPSFTGAVQLASNGSLHIGDNATIGSTLGASAVSGTGTLYFSTPDALTFTGQISGPNLGVDQNGSGTTTLTPMNMSSPGANIYYQTTFIDAGTLTDGEANAFSPNSPVSLAAGTTLAVRYNETIAGLADTSSAGAVTFVGSNNPVLTVTQPTTPLATFSFSGAITGNGSLVINGGNALNQQILTGSSTYTGTTTIGGQAEVLLGAGTLGTPTADFTVGSAFGDNAVLSMTSGATVSANDVTIGANPGSAGEIDLSDISTSLAAAGTLYVGKAGSGSLYVYNGTVSDVNAILGGNMGSMGLGVMYGGQWNSSNSFLLGSGGTGELILNGGTISINSGAGTLSMGSGNNSLYVGGSPTQGVMNSAGGILDAAAVTSTGSSYINFNVTQAAPSFYYFTKDGTSGGAPIEIDGPTTVTINAGAVVLSNPDSSYSGTTVVVGELLVGNSSTGIPNSPTKGPVGTNDILFLEGGEISTVTNVTLDNPIQLANTSSRVDVQDDGSYNLTLTGTIAPFSDPDAGLDWCGPGTFSLLNAGSTFTGGIEMRTGTLYLGASSVSDGMGGITSGPAGRGQLKFDNGTTLSAPSGNITVLNPILINDGGGGAFFTVNGNSSGSLILAGGISDNGGTGGLVVKSPVTLAGTSNYGGPTNVQSGGSLTDNGTPYAFSPNSAFHVSGTGVIDIEEPEILFSVDSLGTMGTVNVGFGTGSMELTSGSVFPGILTGNGDIIVDSDLQLTGTSNTFGGNITLYNEGSYLLIGDGFSSGSLGDAAISGVGYVTFNNPGPLTFTGSIFDGVSVTKDGSGVLTFGASNVYSGNTTIIAGTLTDGAIDSFSPNSLMQVSSGTTLAVAYNEQIGGLSNYEGGGTVTIANGVTLDDAITTDSSFQGSIQGLGTLVIDSVGDGSATQTLTGANSYAGGTILGNATLNVSGGSISHPMADFTMGAYAEATSTLDVSETGTIADMNATIGDLNGTHSYATVEQAGSSWTNSGILTVGGSGYGELSINNGGLVSDLSAVVAESSNGGAVYVSGGTWNTSGPLVNVGMGAETLGTVELIGGTMSVGSGSGTVQLGDPMGGSGSLYIGGDIMTGPGPAGILDAATVTGLGPVDLLAFNTTSILAFPYYFTKDGTSSGTPIEIDGAHTHVVLYGGAIALNNPNNTYGNGTAVDGGAVLLLSGSSSGGSADSPYMGPVGSGPLNLVQGARLIAQNNLTLANSIGLEDTDGPVTFNQGTSTTNLTLTGTITGTNSSSGIEWLGFGTLSLANPNNSFEGGVYTSGGTLSLGVGSAIGSGYAGSGDLDFENGSYLTRPNGAYVTVANNVVVEDNGFGARLYITGDEGGSMTFTGAVSDNTSLGQLWITAPVTFGAADNVSRTVVDGTTVEFDNDANSIVTAENTSVVTFTDPFAEVGALSIINSTVDFTGTGGLPMVYDLAMTGGTLRFAPNSTPIIFGFGGDSPGSGNTINLMGSDTTLSFDTQTDILYYGAITGSGGLTIGGGDTGTTLELNGANSYTGSTNIYTGNLAVAGSNQAFGGVGGGFLTVSPGASLFVSPGVTLPNAIGANDGAFIAGNGTLAPTATQTLAIQNGTTIVGGAGDLSSNYSSIATSAAIGTLTFGSTVTLEFRGAGRMEFPLMNDTGMAGTDYGTVSVNGTLDLSALSPSSVFVVQVVGVGTGGAYTDGTPLSFNAMAPHTWTLLTAGTIIDPSGGFSTSDFDIFTGELNYSGGGTWSVSEGLNSLELNFTPVPEPSTWVLLAGGAGAVGLLAWRRRRSRAAVAA